MHQRSFHTVLVTLAILLAGTISAAQQRTEVAAGYASSSATARVAAVQRQARRFARGRTVRGEDEPSVAAQMAAARAQHAAMLAHAGTLAQAVPLSTAWQPMGPSQVLTPAYGLVSGRVTSIAIDTADMSGNTVYLGTTGGGVWKSTNALGPQAAVRFLPLTDTLPAFSANSASSAVPSLSIGAVAVQPGGTGVVLAGTGDPNDGLDSYYGTGLLRSADGGQTWALIPGSQDGVAGNHSFFGEGFAGFAWSDATTGLVVAAVSSSAEGSITQASSAGASARGLYYSTDAGATWQMSTIEDGGQTVQSAASDFRSFEGNAATAVVWNAVRQRFYAAVRFHGFYESADGVTFTRLAAQPGAGLSAEACPARSGATGLQACPIFRGVLAAQPASGDLFALYASAGNQDGGLWQDSCGFDGRVCTSGAVSWSTYLDSSPMDDSTGALPQADYNLALAAVPAATALSVSDTLLFAGTSEMFRCSLAGGCRLRNTTNATTGCAAPAMVAAAQHAIAWFLNPANTAEPQLLFGNDGGLWRSLDGVRQQSTPCSADDATHFNNLNGALGSLAEASSLAGSSSDANTMLVALGANGSAAATTATQATAQSAWVQMGAGESGGVAIDQANPQLWYVQSGAGVSLHRCGKGASCTSADFAGPPSIGATQVGDDTALTAPPFLLDPALNTNLITGTCRVWRGQAADGASWSVDDALSPPLSSPRDPSCANGEAEIRSLAAGGSAVLTSAVQTSGSPVLYAGLAGSADGGGSFGGHLFVTAAANTADRTTPWTDVTFRPVANDSSGFNARGFDISSITVDPHDTTGATVYATVLGFGVPHVYRSTDRGNTWNNVTANLPNAPANAVAVDPNDANTVYVAMDTGVYATTMVASCAAAGTECWSAYGTALPNAPVVSLVAAAGVTVPGAIAPGALRAGTYGRGIWQIPLLTGGPIASPAATVTPASLIFAGQAVNTTSASQTMTVTSSGNVPLVLGRVTATSQWSETDNCAGASLPPGATCSIQVSFSPAMAGAQAGKLTIFGNVPGGYIAVDLSGTGTTATAVAVSPSTAAFADTVVGAASSTRTITVSNSGTGAASLQPATTSGDFSIATETCGATLDPGASCSVSVTFTPTRVGVRSGTLSLVDADGNHTAALSGNGIAGKLSAAPTSLTFLDTTLNTASAAQNVLVTNTGQAPLMVSFVTASGDFSESDTCAGRTIAAGKSCSVSVVFTPTATGARAGTLTVSSNSDGIAGSVFPVALAGNGKGAFNVVLLPQALEFSTILVGGTSAVQNITISNTGIHAGALGTATVTSDFVLKANTCGATLAPQTGCTVSIAFSPTASGSRTGLFSISDDAGTQTATLAGEGSLPATDTLGTTALTFGTQQVTTTSAGQRVMLTNSGDVPLTLVAAQIALGDFTAVNGCGPSLAAHSSCSITLAFAPTSIGVLTGSLVITDVQRSQTVTLSGVAIAGPGVSISPGSMTFSNTGVGNASAGESATLTNNGGVPLSISDISVTGDYGIVAGTNTCSTSVPVAVGGSCTMLIAFAPSAAGSRTGSLTINGNAGVKTVHLLGTGIDFSLNSNGPASATVSSGMSATYALLVRPVATASEPVTFTCAGAPANARCTVNATYSDLSAVNSVAVTLATGVSAPSASARHPRSFPVAALTSVLPMLGLVFGARRRRGRVWLATALGACLVASMAGCGAGRLLPTLGNNTGSSGPAVVTPAGNYPITVAATSAGLSRQVTLTLIVQ